jgi:hypothetical protein
VRAKTRFFAPRDVPSAAMFSALNDLIATAVAATTPRTVDDECALADELVEAVRASSRQRALAWLPSSPRGRGLPRCYPTVRARGVAWPYARARAARGRRRRTHATSHGVEGGPGRAPRTRACAGQVSALALLFPLRFCLPARPDARRIALAAPQCTADTLTAPDASANQALLQALTRSQDECAPAARAQHSLPPATVLQSPKRAHVPTRSRLSARLPARCRSYFHDAAVARLSDKLSAPGHARCVELGVTALSGCMWACGPRLHAAVARGGLLADIVAALVARAWPPPLAQAAARGVAAWADRVRGCPEYKAAAATLRAEGVAVADDDAATPTTPRSAAAAAAASSGGGDGGDSGGSAPGTPRAAPVCFTTRGGVAVPLRANGGVVATAADAKNNAAVQAALRVRSLEALLCACGCARTHTLIHSFSLVHACAPRALRRRRRRRRARTWRSTWRGYDPTENALATRCHARSIPFSDFRCAHQRCTAGR